MQVTLVNGSPNSSIGSVNYTLDGGSNTNGLRNTGNVAPNPDAVQEFRVITNSYPADQGRFGGGSVTMVTKSGTNSIHGTLFEFLRNDKLNANIWVPGQAVAKAPLHRNQFGGTAGGPIIHNKTFIFGSYSGLRERTSYFANTATPLTTKERTGDLSSTSGTAPVDPLNNNVAFPGKIIPTTRIDPVTRKILDTYLNYTPNLANGFYQTSISHPRDSDELIFKAGSQPQRPAPPHFRDVLQHGRRPHRTAWEPPLGAAGFRLEPVQLQLQRHMDRLSVAH